MSLREMVRAVRSRQLSPVDLVAAHLRQAESVRLRVNPFVLSLGEKAIAAARDAEKAIGRGSGRGALHGVPFTVKDSFDVEGLPTLCGSRRRRDHRAGRDAFAVARLREAGAILLGKTNCPEFLGAYETDNAVVGRTNNPWDADRTPGGSSGGEAAAIASFCSPAGLGSDAGGSIRLPAHFCGISGLKPTTGRISTSGHFPPISHPSGLMYAIGPMARSAADLQLLFRVLAVYDPEDPFATPAPQVEAQLSGVRIGLMERFGEVAVEAAVLHAVRKAAGTLESLGFPVEPFQAKGLDRAPNVWAFLHHRLNMMFLRDLLGLQQEQLHWTISESLMKDKDLPPPTARELVENLVIRDRMRREFLRQMESARLLLAPACGVLAFRHRQRRFPTDPKEIGIFEAVMPLVWTNLLGLPSVVIPFTVTGDGLPVGVQLIGKPWDDELLLELAVRLEEARGPLPAPPGC